MPKQRQILMTTALPYANGIVHLGNMIEAIQADIWARFQRLRGHQCLFICGSDAHGTPVMLSAQKQGITPEALVETVHAKQVQAFDGFSISFDNFHTTHSPENQALSNLFYERLQANGDIQTKTISQAFDPDKELFLSDRFIKGDCPRCNAADQYGDNCEACAATYNPMELGNPISVISGATPIEKESLHYFLDLSQYQDFLKAWVNEEHLQPQVINKLKEWLEDDLQAWDISRDAPYFGFEIPGAPGKYFYVWLDAPIGYIASFKNLTEKNKNINFDDYWKPDSKTELYHFIGKDVMYFHTLFWPAMLKGAKFRLPTRIFIHGFLTIDGKKMSKSRGTFITAEKYLSCLSPEYLRYYFAAKLNAQVEDIDLKLEDFLQRVNSDLVGKFVNLASRCAGFIKKKFDGKLATTLHDEALFNDFANASDTIAEGYEKLEFNRTMREIMALTDRANQYIDQHKPWILAKEEGREQEVHLICTQGLNLFKILSTYLKPVLPETAEKIEAFLNVELQWKTIAEPLLNHSINPFKPLMQRVTEDDINALSSHDKV